ncbi:MAG: O-antigen ligase family protein [Enterococcus sp.]
MNLTKIHSYSERSKNPFLLVFGITLIIRIVNYYSLIPSKFDTLLFTGITVWAFIITMMDILTRNFKLDKTDYLLVVFLGAILISTFVNGPTGVVDNIKLLIWQFIYLFAVFRIGKDASHRTIFPLFEKILIGCWNLLVLISLGMFVVNYSYVESFDKFYNGFRAGFVENRLYGMFADPNFASATSVAIIFLALKMFLSKKNKFTSVYSILTIVLQTLYVILSGSRTSEIALFTCAFFVAFFMMYHRLSKTMLVKLLFSFLCALLVSGLTLGVLEAGKNVAPKVATITARHVPGRVKQDPETKTKEEISLRRADVADKDDVSNNRFALWKSSFEIFESSPIVGSSPRNIFEYAEENLPTTFIATKKQTSHNFVFYLLATTGLLGTVPFLVFLIIKIWQTLKRLFTENVVSYDVFLLDTMVVLAILISALFLTELVLVNKIGSFIFWLYLGGISTPKLIKQKSE